MLASVVAGLALAFLLVMLLPQLLRQPPAVAVPSVATQPSMPSSAPATYADAVQRAIAAIGKAHMTDEPRQLMTAFLERKKPRP